MLRRFYAGFATLPWLMRIGLLVVVAGGVLDVIYHSLPRHMAMIVDLYLGNNGWPFHLLTVIGMATTLVGIGVSRSMLRANYQRRAEIERSHAIEQ